MSIIEMIDRISDKGSLQVSASLMSEICTICLDILKHNEQASYNWDVISLYSTPENGGYEQRERYNKTDAYTFLTDWIGIKGMRSSTSVSRALQGLEYIIGMANDDTSTIALECDISAEYDRVGSSINER